MDRVAALDYRVFSPQKRFLSRLTSTPSILISKLKMSGKLAHVYIVDQGSTTEECHSGRTISDLDYALQYVWDKIATVLSANRKTWKVGVLGLRSDDTSNALSEGEGYENINLLQDIDEIEISHLHALQDALKPSSTEAGDAISAIVVAIDMIERHCRLGTGKQGKFGKKIVLVTDGQGDIDDGGDQAHINSIADRINELDIELIILWVLDRLLLIHRLMRIVE